MSGQAYWLKKCDKLKSDMEAMGDVPMKAHGPRGFIWQLLPFPAWAVQRGTGRERLL